VIHSDATKIGAWEKFKFVREGKSAQLTIISPLPDAKLGTRFTITGTASCEVVEDILGDRSIPVMDCTTNITAVAVRVGDTNPFQVATPTGSGTTPWATWSHVADITMRGPQTITASISIAGQEIRGNYQHSITVYGAADLAPATKEVILFADANYLGKFQSLGKGKYDTAQIVIGNKTLSSALIPRGMVLRLYEQPNFQGTFIDLRGDTPAVGADWNDRASSFIVDESVPLSLDDIFRPFNEFFSKMFAAGDGTPATFRFFHLPRAFVDSDFLIPAHPEAGPSPAIAQEQFSAVIDGVPRLDPDGRTVWLGRTRLSDLYHDEILDPAIAFVPGNVTNDTDKQARIDAFNQTKADAQKIWETTKAMSVLEGDGVRLHITTAQPEKWWDKTNKDVWNHKSFQVKSRAPQSGQAGPSPDQLLRRKADDNVTQQIASSPLKKRLEIQSMLATNAPMESLLISEVTISFDYCVVTLALPYVHDAFINNLSWYIPNHSKGQLSANDGHGTPVLPASVVAIKHLSIQAPWTAEDITNLEQSVQFGPFNFDPKVIDGAIVHEGIQIIGGLFQYLPDLPPNTAPSMDVSTPPSSASSSGTVTSTSSSTSPSSPASTTSATRRRLT
jgi:hypothetical protein